MPVEKIPPSTCGKGGTRARVFGASALVVVSLAVFLHDLSREPRFMDESAYVSQSYFLDLLAEPDSPFWLEYPAYDLPPLPKYSIGIALRLSGHRLPNRSAMKTWYDDPTSDCTTPSSLYAARIPSVILGCVGVLAVFGIGCAWMGTRAGMISALLMVANPLYRLHARRAMSDDYAEALLLLTAALAIRFWSRSLDGTLRRRDWLLVFAIGVCGGLAVLAKLNGGLGLMIVAGWVVLACVLPKATRAAKLRIAAMGFVASCLSYGVFVALNPFLTARPPARILALPGYEGLRPIAALDLAARTKMLIDHRVDVSRIAQTRKPLSNDALLTMRDKFSAVFVQGFGRFGPFGRSHSDSTKRYDWSQDWGAALYLPIVFAGAILAFRRGSRESREGRPPTSWAISLQALIAIFTVTLFIPLAWDRYFLSIQAGSSLLATGVVIAAWDSLQGWASGRRGEAVS